MQRQNIEERFLSYVKKIPGGCWIWTGSVQKARGGYGQFMVKPKVWRSHRWSFQFYRGPIPDGALVCHKCDNPRCVNPDHLFLGTYSDNLVDAIRKGRNAAPQPSRLRGAQHHNAKLTQEQASEIRAQMAAGVPRVHIAADFGVCVATLYNIYRNGRYDRQ